MPVSELYTRLHVPVRSTETLAQYKALPKSKQDNLKDVGGVMGGLAQNGSRQAGSVVYRDVITLDMDSIPPWQTDAAVNRILSMGCSVCIHSTRKHSPETPRLRAFFPIDRPVTADEYGAIARKVAQLIEPNMSWFDKTTFDVNRIMYWPSVCSDSQYVYHWLDGPFVPADGILALYRDWRSFAELPLCPAEDMTHAPATRQEDPLEKKGIVGAFNREYYPIEKALDTYLPGVYTPAGDGRYTYAKGSTTGGAIVYDDKYIYSHHATDPASGLLCNAFDIVRVHLFSDLDASAKEGTPSNKLPSFMKMRELAASDNAVNMRMRTEGAAGAYEDFIDAANAMMAGASGSSGTSGPSGTPDNNAGNPTPSGGGSLQNLTAWMSLLKADGNNNYVKSYENVLIALENDPLLKGRIYMNTFTQRPMAIAPLPWGYHKTASVNTPFEWTDADDDGLVMYLERLIGIRTKSIMTTALNECRALHPFHPVKAYLAELIWDGVPRLETVFQTYLGAEDTPYVRALAKMTFVAAVTRIYFPGKKFDTALVLVGDQGLGKTAFIATMAKRHEWYTDNIKTLDRAAIENIQGVWLAEFGELSVLKRNELEDIKSFMSRQVDRTRLAYGHYAVSLPRTCIFFGTTNTYNFLRDSTGERRFYPIDVGVVPPSKSVFYDLPGEVDQIWAEALYYYREGRTALILPANLMQYAKGVQEMHFDHNEKQGLIEEFLGKLIPRDWDDFTLDQRMLFYADTKTQYDNLVPRDRVCAIEIWCECLGGRKENYKPSIGWELNGILRNIPGWHYVKTPRKYPIYGSQRGFEKYED